MQIFFKNLVLIICILRKVRSYRRLVRQQLKPIQAIRTTAIHTPSCSYNLYCLFLRLGLVAVTSVGHGSCQGANARNKRNVGSTVVELARDKEISDDLLPPFPVRTRVEFDALNESVKEKAVRK